MKNKLVRKNIFFVYILQCRDKTYYTGYTTDLERRLNEHNGSARGAKCLRGKLPVTLVWSKKFKSLSDAMKTEYAIKQLNKGKKTLLVKNTSSKSKKRGCSFYE